MNTVPAAAESQNAVIVVRFGEIFLKAGNRSFFERKLVENMRRLVAGIPGVKVVKLHARVIVETPPHEMSRVLQRLGRCFGIVSLSPAQVVPKDLGAITDEAMRVAREAQARLGRKPTFKVETKRSDKHFPMRSLDISREVGTRIYTDLEFPVDVHKPELEIGVEVGPLRTFVFSERVPGPGGLPVGTAGKVNLLISGGIDSPVAGWLAMKRGCSLVATYFHAFPYVGDRTKEKVTDLVKRMAAWGGEIPFYVVNFTEVQKTLRYAGPAELAVVLYRRMMMRASAKIATHERALALVTGDNLAQVASQTLENMTVIENAAPIPVLRPLLTYDKLETIGLAKKIGTFETSIEPYDDCCSLFVPAHPATKAKLDVVQDAESKLDIEAAAETLFRTAERIVVSA